MKNLFLVSLSALLLTACNGGSSGGNGALTSNPPTTNTIPDSKTFPGSILVNGNIGNFKGEFINKNLSWSHKNADGSVSIKTKAVRLSIEQNANKIRVTVWNGIGSTGLTFIQFGPDFFDIDPSTQKLSKKDYLTMSGLIGMNSFYINNEGEDYPNGPDAAPVEYAQIIQVQKITDDKMFLRMEFKNTYMGNMRVSEDTLEGEVTLDK